MEKLSHYFGTKARVLHSNDSILKAYIVRADLMIGGVLIAGAKAPKIINKTMLSSMKRGNVLVDVAIDQGGCFETSHATTHTELML